MNLKETIRSIPGWPIEGVTFRDLTTMMQHPEAFAYACDLLYDRYRDKGIDKIVGIDARGFVFGGVVAYKLGIGFVPVRKKANSHVGPFKKPMPWSMALIPWKCMRMPYLPGKKW